MQNALHLMYKYSERNSDINLFLIPPGGRGVRGRLSNNSILTNENVEVRDVVNCFSGVIGTPDQTRDNQASVFLSVES